MMRLVVGYPDAGVLNVKFKPARSTKRRLGVSQEHQVGGVEEFLDSWYHTVLVWIHWHHNIRVIPAQAIVNQ